MHRSPTVLDESCHRCRVINGLSACRIHNVYFTGRVKYKSCGIKARHHTHGRCKWYIRNSTRFDLDLVWYHLYLPQGWLLTRVHNGWFWDDAAIWRLIHSARFLWKGNHGIAVRPEANRMWWRVTKGEWWMAGSAWVYFTTSTDTSHRKITMNQLYQWADPRWVRDEVWKYASFTVSFCRMMLAAKG